MNSTVTYEKMNGLGIVSINHPPLNVLSQQVFQELKNAFLQLKEDEEIVAVLVTGAGNRAFVAGADIKEFPQLIGNRDMKESVMEGHRVLTEIQQFPKPTIAVLNGLTLGGGCELALSCDMRIAEEHAQIGLPEITLGLFPGAGGTQRLPRLVGAAKAKELMYTGEAISAKEAERIGLVNSVVETGKGVEAGIALAKKMTRHSLQVLSRIKQAVDHGLDTTLENGIEIEANLLVEVFQTEDIKEGVSAFIEKRKPVFRHR
ncbi:enoyl-CoA hydratase [Cytobacillus spongiae]|uniref:enoyl-CoA hydratase n=1 Tax=Cytobacillus spongiae TaxID=2901381 RepID=UPI001F337BF2|nr:enoyl-CoA hydratase [Cytobacillus spongiae]UII56800.1 enoyl-CoA hydratase [Cytobacillus spongiae]